MTLQGYLQADENLLVSEVEQRSWEDSDSEEILVVAPDSEPDSPESEDESFAPLASNSQALDAINIQ